MKNLGNNKFFGMVTAAWYCGVYCAETEKLEKEAKKALRTRNIHPRGMDYSEAEHNGLEPFLEMVLGGAAIE